MTDLDQFYTKPVAASQCFTALRTLLRELVPAGGGDLQFVEPSAGAGVFLDLLPASTIAIDIEPGRNDIQQQDFLQWKPVGPTHSPSNVVVVGNPPFGTRGRLAIDFINHAAEFADTIAFIVPVIFRKHLIQKQLVSDLRLLHTLPLRRDSFLMPNGSPYTVNTVFQIWTRLASSHPDLRIHQQPPLKHPDFVFWQYNNTVDALKVFDNEFDFAVPCQGWQDYSRRETSPDACEKHKQWMLFKPANKSAKNRLHDDIDYDELSMKYTTSTPGFRKGDLVQEYTERYG